MQLWKKSLMKKYDREYEEIKNHFKTMNDEFINDAEISLQEKNEYKKTILNYAAEISNVDDYEDEVEDIEVIGELEGGYLKISKAEYDACIDSYPRKDLTYYIRDDVFISTQSSEVYDDLYDLPVEEFDMSKRIEYWKSDDYERIFKIKYINKNYENDVGFIDPPKPKSKPRKKIDETDSK